VSAVSRLGVLGFAGAMIATLAVGGCSIVRIQVASKDDVEVKRGFGMVSVTVKPTAKATVVESTSFGVINGFEGFALGYHSATVAAFGGESCQLILWIKTNDQLQQLNELLRDRTDVCVVRSHQAIWGRP
jgi:hypothetical protein